MTKEDKICCIFNFAPHYREDIYLLLDEHFECDFYFGNKTYSKIKKINYSKFRNPIIEFDFRTVFAKFYYLKGQPKLSSKKYKYYIITGQPYNLSDWLLIIKNAIIGNKTFIWNHGLYGKESFFKKLILKVQFKLITGYFLYGNYAKEIMQTNGFKESKLHVIYNSLNYKKSSSLRPKMIRTKIFEEHFENDFPNLIFIGRLTKIKKLNLLFEALKESLNKSVKYNITLIGDGLEKEFLENFVVKKRLSEYVWFFGSCYKEEIIAELIYNADICVSPGNIGLTAIHSLSYGTPAITHDNFKRQMPEYESIIEGFSGSFFKENDYYSLSRTIENWIAKYPNKNKEVISNCFSIIDEYYNPFFQINLLKKTLN